MKEKLNYILILALIFISFSCKIEKKNDTLNLKTEKKLEIDSLNSSHIQIDKKKPFVISVSVKSFFLNDFNLSNSFNEENMIEVLGKPDKYEKSTDYIDETGFPDYDIDYGKNNIWASYGFVSDVYVRDANMNINGIKLGDERDKVEKLYDVNTKTENYIQLVNSSDESNFIKFDKNNVIIELKYSKLIL